MRIAKWSFLTSLLLLIGGCATCVPGICGCAASIFPSSWEEYTDLPALVADMVGLAGCVVSGIVWLVLWTRNKTAEDTRRLSH